jgi:hypothetical protein
VGTGAGAAAAASSRAAASSGAASSGAASELSVAEKERRASLIAKLDSKLSFLQTTLGKLGIQRPKFESMYDIPTPAVFDRIYEKYADEYDRMIKDSMGV